MTVPKRAVPNRKTENPLRIVQLDLNVTKNDVKKIYFLSGPSHKNNRKRRTVEAASSGMKNFGLFRLAHFLFYR